LDLGLADGAGWADIRAGTTIFALGGIDYIEAIDLGDSAIGAFAFASAALNAVIFTNNVGHDSFLSRQFLLSLITTR